MPSIGIRLPKQRQVWVASALAAAAIVTVAVVRLPARRLGLQAYGVAPGQMRIEWNRRAAPVLNASSAVLEIEDGKSHVHLALNADQLKTSSITYAQHSGDVLVRMRLESRKPGTPPAEESIRFVGPAGPATTAPGAQAGGVVGSAPASPATPSDPPARSQEASREAPPPEPDTAAPAEVSGPQPPQPRPREERPIRRIFAFTPPPQALATASRPEPLPAPPSVSPASTSALASLPVAAPAPPLYSGPRSGRLIWTGSLGKRGVVEIDGAHASVGSLVGALPVGVPLSLRVSPAEFGSGGLVVYTTDAARNQKHEPAGGANGWNATTFEWDPQRAAQITILEPPGRNNDYRRLVLRNDARRCPVIVIEWSVR
jgi:hypothetical protein